MNMHKLNLLFALASLPLVLQPSIGHCRPLEPVAIVDPANVTLDHISIEVTGKGAPIFLIPGLSSPRETWTGQVPELAKTHRVYLVQVNGFGGDAPGANLKPGILDGIVADLDGYIVRNRIKDAAIVGHSLGGLIGLMFAKAHPGDVSRLMIVDSLPYAGEIFLPGATVAAIEPQARMIRDQIAATYGSPANDAIAQSTANTLALKPDSRTKVKAWALAADPRVSAQALYEDMTTDLRSDLASIATPITLVFPWNDVRPTKVKADARYRGAYAKAPHVTFVDIGDAAHFAMLDQPEAFAAALKAFADGK